MRRDCGSEMDSPTRQPPCAHQSTRRRPRSANLSLTTACTLVPVNSAHPDAQLTSLTRHVLLVDVRASDGMPPASPLSQPRADATLQSHSQLLALGGRTGTAFEDETTGRCRTRGARAGGARVDRRHGTRHGAAHPRAVRALERLALPRDLLVLVVVAWLGRAPHAARVETGGRRRALDRRWHRSAERAARARRWRPVRSQFDAGGAQHGHAHSRWRRGISAHHAAMCCGPTAPVASGGEKARLHIPRTRPAPPRKLERLSLPPCGRLAGLA